MKRAFNTADQVLHLWANQSQSDARCANVFFEGPKVWSYGTHYLLGKIHQHKGHTIAVINSTKYSVTTAKHQRYAFDAVAHLPRVYSSDPENILLGLRETQDELISGLFDFFSQRSFYSGYTIEDNEYRFQEIGEFNNLCKILNKPEMKIDFDKDFLALMREHVALCHAKALERQSPEALAKKELERAKRETKNREKLKTSIEAWYHGGPLVEGMRNLVPQLVRINGFEVETTRGARVPLMKAKAMLVKILKGNAKKGDKVGNFELVRVDGSQVTIGCHLIDLEQAKEILLKEGA